MPYFIRKSQTGSGTRRLGLLVRQQMIQGKTAKVALNETLI